MFKEKRKGQSQQSQSNMVRLYDFQQDKQSSNPKLTRASMVACTGNIYDFGCIYESVLLF